MAASGADAEFNKDNVTAAATTAEEEQLRAMFGRMDVAGRGYITPEDQCFQPEVFLAMDADGDGRVTFADFQLSFVQAQARLVRQGEPVEAASRRSSVFSELSPEPTELEAEGEKSQLRMAFDALDRKNRGYLSVASVEALWAEQRFGRPLSLSIVADPDHQVTFEEFAQEVAKSTAAEAGPAAAGPAAAAPGAVVGGAGAGPPSASHAHAHGQMQSPGVTRKPIAGLGALDSPIVYSANKRRLEQQVDDLSVQLANARDEIQHMRLQLKTQRHASVRHSELADQQAQAAELELQQLRKRQEERTKAEAKRMQSKHQAEVQLLKLQLQDAQVAVAALRRGAEASADQGDESRPRLKRLSMEVAELGDALRSEQESTLSLRKELVALHGVQVQFEALKATSMAEAQDHGRLADEFQRQAQKLKDLKDANDELREQAAVAKRRSELLLTQDGHSLASELDASQPGTKAQLQALEDDNARLLAAMTRIQGSLEQERAALAEASQARTASLTSECQRLKTELMLVRQEGHEKQREREAAALRLAEVEEVARVLRGQNQRLNDEFAQRHGMTLQELLQLNEDLKTACADLEGRLGTDTATLIKENEGLKRLYKKLRLEKQAGAKLARSTHAQLSDNYAKAKTTAEELEANFWSQAEQIDGLRRQLIHSQAMRKELEARLLHAEGAEARLADLPGPAAREGDGPELQGVVAGLQQSLRVAEEKLAHCWMTIADQQQQLARRDGSLNSKSNIDAVFAELDEVQGELMVAHERVAALTDENDRLRRHLAPHPGASASPVARSQAGRSPARRATAPARAVLAGGSPGLQAYFSAHGGLPSPIPSAASVSHSGRGPGSALRRAIASGSRMQQLVAVNQRKVAAIQDLNASLGSGRPRRRHKRYTTPLASAEGRKLGTLHRLNDTLSKASRSASASPVGTHLGRRPTEEASLDTASVHSDHFTPERRWRNDHITAEPEIHIANPY